MENNENQNTQQENEQNDNIDNNNSGNDQELNQENENDKEEENQNEEEKDAEENKDENNLEGLNNVHNESGDEDEEDNQDNESKQFFQTVRESNCRDILDFYEKLRENFSKTNKKWEDKDFDEDYSLFKTDEENDDYKNENKYKFEHIKLEDEKAPFFLVENGSKNLNYEFKIKRGVLQDRFFLGAFLMLFRRREEFFQNLILDYDNIKENLNAGFCGFTFFIDGEWKNITIDTRVHKNLDDLALSNIETSNAFWMCLFEKAYAKAFKSYEVLKGSLINDYLVDLTGGYARNITISSNKQGEMKESKKKALFEEIEKYLAQGYLIGCMKWDESTKDEDCASEKSEDGVDEDQIVSNCMYNILDVNMDNSNRIIYLVNYWGKGKWTGSYSVEDETWEANKALADRLNYTVSQSDGTFWMTFDDFLNNFNKIYYCRIFPEKWSQFCIEGKWSAITSGGAPPKILPWYPERYEKQGFSQTSKAAQNIISPLDKLAAQKKSSTMNQNILKNKLYKIEEEHKNIKKPPDNKLNAIKNIKYAQTQKTSYTLGNYGQANEREVLNENNKGAIKQNKKEPRFKKQIFKRNIITDTEDRWFLNPQYKIEMEPSSKMIISLIQRDQKLKDNKYLKVCFYIMYCRGKYSRVWEIKPENIIKIAQEEKENGREIIMNLDYFEILKKVNEIRIKKLQKGEKIQLNLIPFIDYNTKYEIEKTSKSTIQFKPYEVKADFWLRIFSSAEVYIAELAKPYECTLKSQWCNDDNIYSTGGARFITEGRLRENPKWPINPQFLLTFDKDIQMKIILRKTNGRFSNESNKIGILLCKPEFKEDEGFDKKAKNNNEGSGVKVEQIKRVMESAEKILDNRQKNRIDQIYPKMTINSSEWIAESSYSNEYCACLFMKFNKIDSPVIIVPTLDSADTPFEFELIIYSNKSATVTPLINDYCKLLIGEWKESLSGGSHLTQDEKKKGRGDSNIELIGRELTWYDNPKYQISFKSQEKIEKVEFEIILTRFDSIWKPIIAKGIVNSMIGIYVFQYNQIKWKERCLNFDTIDFLPKNTVSISFSFSNVDPSGFIIMPVTYGAGIKGPFLIMAKCKEPFIFKELDSKFK